MRRPVLRSLTSKILLESGILLACLFAVIITGGAAFQRTIVREMEAKSTEILRGLQVEIGQTAGPVEELLVHLREQQEVDAIVLFDQHEQLAASAQSARFADTPMGAPGDGLQIREVHGAAGPLTAYVQTLPIEGANGAILGYVKVALAVEPQTAILRAFQSKAVLGLSAVFCLTTVALCLTVASALRPLRELSRHIAGVGEGALDPVQVDATSSEVAVLQEQFNDMVASLEEKTVMAERLRQTERVSAMGNLAAGLAHDIGNPLNALKLTASHLRDLLHADGAEHAGKHAAAIEAEVDRLDGLVHNFLALARDRPPEKVLVAVDDLMHDVVGLVGTEARRRDIVLHHQFDAGPRPLAIDAAQMKGAIVNVVVNAFDAAGPGGTVELRSSRDNGTVDIAVTDSGPGIPPDVRDRMFEPYFTTKANGTGLGLALTRTVVEQHGGEVAVVSGPGVGTTLTIRLAAEGAYA